MIVRGKKDGAVEKSRKGQATTWSQQPKKAAEKLLKRSLEEWEKCPICL